MLLSERLNGKYNQDYVKQIFERMKEEQNIVIFGAGDRAQWLGKMLLKNGIDFKGFWINEKYYVENRNVRAYGYNKPVMCFEKEVEHEKDAVVLLGIAKHLLNLDIFKKAGIKEVIPINLGIRDDYLLDYEFYQQESQELDRLYEMLEDDYSRECLYAHLLGRMTGRDIEFEPSAWSDPQYFLDGLMDWRENECLVDCGAYNGDTVEEFLNKMPKNTVKQYKVYAWEPDRDNYDLMVEKYKANDSVIPVLKGAFSRSDRLYFSEGDGETSAISDSGNVVIDVDSIDNVLGDDKATFIKMDIEGSELEALHGAEKQIVKNKPRLAICVYHKKEDLSTIPRYIKGLNPEYKFFLRTHSKMPTELVLFCI